MENCRIVLIAHRLDFPDQLSWRASMLANSRDRKIHSTGLLENVCADMLILTMTSRESGFSGRIASCTCHVSSVLLSLTGCKVLVSPYLSCTVTILERLIAVVKAPINSSCSALDSSLLLTITRLRDSATIALTIEFDSRIPALFLLVCPAAPIQAHRPLARLPHLSILFVC